MSPDMTPLEERFLQETDARISELESARQEYDRLVDLRQRLKGGSSPAPRSSSGSRSRSSSSTASSNGRGNGANRKEQLLQIIRANPGITASGVAKEMGLKAPTYVYRLRDEVVKDGTVRVEDGKMFVVEGKEPAAAAA